MSDRGLALRFAAATAVASLVWTVVLLELTRTARLADVALLLPAELAGGMLGPLAARWLTPSRRLQFAVIGYALVRAAIVPSLATGRVAPVALSLAAGMCWRLLSGGVIAAAASRSATAVAKCQAWSSAAATFGTALAPWLLAMPHVGFAAISILIVGCLRVPVPSAGSVGLEAGTTRMRRWHLPPAPLVVAAAVIAGTTTALPRLLPAVTELSVGARWVSAASVVAFAVTFLLPALVRRVPPRSATRTVVLAGISLVVWLPAARHPALLLAAVAIGNLARQIADVHVDVASAVGPDPSRTVVNVQALQGLASAATAALVAVLLTRVGLGLLSAALLGLLVLGCLPELVWRRQGPSMHPVHGGAGQSAEGGQVR
jgi:hypothetical protein